MSANQKIALLAPGKACESRVFTYTAKNWINIQCNYSSIVYQNLIIITFTYYLWSITVYIIDITINA